MIVSSEKRSSYLRHLRSGAVSLPIASVVGSIAIASSIFFAHASEEVDLAIPSAPWVPYQLRAQLSDETPKYIEQEPFVLNRSHPYFSHQRAHLFSYLNTIELESFDDIISSSCPGHAWWAYIYDAENLQAPITRERFYMGPALRQVQRLRDEWHNDITPGETVFIYLQTPQLDDGCQLFIDGRSGEDGRNQLYTEFLAAEEEPVSSIASSESSSSSLSAVASVEADVSSASSVASEEEERTITITPRATFTHLGLRHIGITVEHMPAKHAFWLVPAGTRNPDRSIFVTEMLPRSGDTSIVIDMPRNARTELILYDTHHQEFIEPGFPVHLNNKRRISVFPPEEHVYSDLEQEIPATDSDEDGIYDALDNCPLDPNPEQTDSDSDLEGDACDTDDDGDGIEDESDHCPLTADPSNTDADNDGIGDVCDTDADNDGIEDEVDNCPVDANADQTDSDSDSVGDICDPDDDGDGIEDESDLCPLTADPSNVDSDNDGIGDICDPDDDGDSVPDDTDHCPLTPDPSNTDTDEDGLGDVCDPDDDDDTVVDTEDNCPLIQNSEQIDSDEDGEGDACDGDDDNDGIEDEDDLCPLIADSSNVDTDHNGQGDVCDPDDDGDGIEDETDSCPLIADSSNTDTDGDGIGDLCDTDNDGDGVDDTEDNCFPEPNPLQTDTDNDGDGDACDPDDDGDGVLDEGDNCSLVPNPEQIDSDNDGEGDACDPDDDGDSVPDDTDHCPLTPDPSNADTDEDGIGDACDDDDDGDGIADEADSCPLIADSSNTDTDADGIGDACDPDDDNDSISDDEDNCPLDANPGQEDLDEDGEGDLCDPDDDGDGVLDEVDNCPRTANANQEDIDEDDIGDVCEGDRDEDGVIDDTDNCPDNANPDQEDLEGDDVGDVCDDDDDNDSVVDEEDLCPRAADPSNTDTDNDGQGDVCDSDDDGDGIADTADLCPLTPDPSNVDSDNDGIGDICDPDDDGDSVPDDTDLCPLTPDPSNVDTDADGEGDACDDDDDDDGILDVVDRCPLIADRSQIDSDNDGTGDACDLDIDGDGIENEDDICPEHYDPAQPDQDEDDVGDSCDPDIDGDEIENSEDLCPLDPEASQTDTDSDGAGDDCDHDDDGDGVPDEAFQIPAPGLVAGPVIFIDMPGDNCPLDSNFGQVDLDGDGLGDVCDPDLDGDLILNEDDNCEEVSNPGQEDRDGDNIGDVCDTDTDGDGVIDTEDNCPHLVNPEQTDTDGDGIGDMCDPDDDNDSIADESDLCPLTADPSNADTDDDGEGDACDDDDDGDSVPDTSDVCRLISDDSQTDTDADGIGDACDPDDDQDGILDGRDNCPLTVNTNQLNADGDHLGDACDPDDDNDSIADESDLCPLTADPSNIDADDDGLGDVCDDDDDNDRILDTRDNCPLVANADQRNSDSVEDGGDACDEDDDNDGKEDEEDNCPLHANADQVDADGDGIGDVCDQDLDGDGDSNTVDNCPNVSNPQQTDTDGDGVGDVCDTDSDDDGILDIDDVCPLDPEASQTDTDNDGVGNDCEDDDDNDGIADDDDLCPLTADPSNADTDEDGIGDACDDDDDDDGILDEADRCPLIADSSNADTDEDGVGDACDPDDDNDSIADEADRCPLIADSSNTDTDGDGDGNACDDDDDDDGILDEADRCPLIADRSNIDTDGDGVGDACDPDDDNDGIADDDDLCPLTADSSNTDTDGDGDGNACDDDDDNDGIADESDRCPLTADPSNADTDEDGVGDACGDLCPEDPEKLMPLICGCGNPEFFDADGECTDEDAILSQQQQSLLANRPVIVPTSALQPIETTAFERVLNQLASITSVLKAQVTSEQEEENPEEEVLYDPPPESETEGFALKANHPFLAVVDEKCLWERHGRGEDTTEADAYFEEFVEVPEQIDPNQRLYKDLYPIVFDTPQPFDRVWNMVTNHPCITGFTEDSESEIVFEGSLGGGSSNYLDQIKFTEAHPKFDTLTGDSPNRFVTVATIDTGYDFDNEDAVGLYGDNLQGTNYSPFISDVDPEGELPNVPQDTWGHGTGVGSIIAADAHNGIGMRGIASDVTKLLPFKMVTDVGQMRDFSLHDLYRMIDHAVDAGAEVINMSIGANSDVCNPVLSDVINEALLKGVVFAVSAGNGNRRDANGALIPGKILHPSDDGPPEFGPNTSPGCLGRVYKGVLSVASLRTGTNDLACHSNFGEPVEIAAPGTRIPTYGLNNQIVGLNGTSFASPQVAAAQALVISTFKANGWSYSPWLVEDVILNASPVVEGLTDVINGGRVLDLDALAEYLQDLEQMSDAQRIRIPSENHRSGQGWNPNAGIERIKELVVSPNNIELTPGESVPLAATVVYNDGTIEEVTTGVCWSTQDPVSVPIVGQNLVVNGNATPGRQVRIIGNYRGQSSTAIVTILEDSVSDEIGTLELESLTEPQWGELIQMQLSDEHRDHLTSRAEWTSSDPDELTSIDSIPGLFSSYQAVANKEYTVTARIGGTQQSTSFTLPPREIDRALIHSPLGDSVFQGDPITLYSQLMLRGESSPRPLIADWSSRTQGFTLNQAGSSEVTISTGELEPGFYSVQATGTFTGAQEPVETTAVYTFEVTQEYDRIEILYGTRGAGLDEVNPANRALFILRRYNEGLGHKIVDPKQVSWRTSDPVRLPIDENGIVYPTEESLRLGSLDQEYTIYATYPKEGGSTVSKNVIVTNRTLGEGTNPDAVFIRIVSPDGGDPHTEISWSPWNYHPHYQLRVYREDGGYYNVDGTTRHATWLVDHPGVNFSRSTAGGQDVARFTMMPTERPNNGPFKITAEYTGRGLRGATDDLVVTVPPHEHLYTEKSITLDYRHPSRTRDVSVRPTQSAPNTINIRTTYDVQDPYHAVVYLWSIVNNPQKGKGIGDLTHADTITLPLQDVEIETELPLLNTNSLQYYIDMETLLEGKTELRQSYEFTYRGTTNASGDPEVVEETVIINFDIDKLEPIRETFFLGDGARNEHTDGIDLFNESYRSYFLYEEYDNDSITKLTDPDKLTVEILDENGELAPNAGYKISDASTIQYLYLMMWGDEDSSRNLTLRLTHEDLGIKTYPMRIEGIASYDPPDSEASPARVLPEIAADDPKCSQPARRNADAFAGGSGTQGSPFEICTKEQLLNLQSLLSGQEEPYVSLLTNLDFCPDGDVLEEGECENLEEPILIDQGLHFNGNGHEIRNVLISNREVHKQGLFGEAPHNHNMKSFKHLILRNFNVIGEDAVGVLAGQLRRVDIDNVHVVSSKVRGTRAVGGMVGLLWGSLDQEIKNASVRDTEVLFTHDSAGGMIGWHANPRHTGNYVQATITGLGAAGNMERVGGIIGHAQGYNNVSTDFEGIYPDPIARNETGIPYYPAIIDSAFEGSITTGHGNNGLSAAGGIAGYAYRTLSVLRASVEADIVATGKNVGGIVGEHYAISTGRYNFITGVLVDNTFDGTITAGAGRRGNSFAGGIVGYGETGWISGGRVSGKLEGIRHVGGVVGGNVPVVRISDVIVDMEIDSSSNQHGAVIGMVEHESYAFDQEDLTYTPVPFFTNVRWNREKVSEEIGGIGVHGDQSSIDHAGATGVPAIELSATPEPAQSSQQSQASSAASSRTPVPAEVITETRVHYTMGPRMFRINPNGSSTQLRRILELINQTMRIADRTIYWAEFDAQLDRAILNIAPTSDPEASSQFVVTNAGEQGYEILDFEVDAERNLLYTIMNSAVYVTDLGEENSTRLVLNPYSDRENEETGMPSFVHIKRLALDRQQQKLYILSHSTSIVARVSISDLSDLPVEEIEILADVDDFRTIPYPELDRIHYRSIAVSDDYIYISAHEAPRSTMRDTHYLFRSSKDTFELEDVTPNGFHTATHLRIDPRNERLYWVARGIGDLMTAMPNGDHVVTLVDYVNPMVTPNRTRVLGLEIP